MSCMDLNDVVANIRMQRIDFTTAYYITKKPVTKPYTRNKDSVDMLNLLAPELFFLAHPVYKM